MLTCVSYAALPAWAIQASMHRCPHVSPLFVVLYIDTLSQHDLMLSNTYISHIRYSSS